MCMYIYILYYYILHLFTYCILIILYNNIVETERDGLNNSNNKKSLNNYTIYTICMSIQSTPKTVTRIGDKHSLHLGGPTLSSIKQTIAAMAHLFVGVDIKENPYGII